MYVDKVQKDKVNKRCKNSCFSYYPNFDAAVTIGNATKSISCKGKAYTFESTAEKVLDEGVCCSVGEMSTCWFDAQKAASSGDVENCLHYGNFSTDPAHHLIIGGVMVFLVVLSCACLVRYGAFVVWMEENDPRSRISGRWSNDAQKGKADKYGKADCEWYEKWRKQNPSTAQSSVDVANPVSSGDWHARI
jgi:hypothetical protein